MPIHRAAVLITSHNRRELTLASLSTLFRQRSIGDLETDVFLVDDGCTDGTGQAVRARFPSVHVLRGDGSLYWNGGMRLAMAVAMKIGFDAYILMNDDTILYQDALQRVVFLARERLAGQRPAIVVGSMRSPHTGVQSYGGITKSRHGIFLDLRLIQAHPSRPVPCDTMHGNFVLIPAEVVSAVGMLDEHFRHQFADLDYGLRAKAAGFDVVAIPGYAGDCRHNSAQNTWRDRDLPLCDRWRHLISPKGVPMREWLLFTHRHFGWRGPVYACSPYARTLISGLLPRARRQPRRVLGLEEGSL